jgi:hypothetical protein
MRRTLAFGMFLAWMMFSPALAAVDTVWNFNGNLAADLGTSTMSFRGNTAAYTTFGTTAAYGLSSLYGDNGTAEVMAFPAAAPSQGYAVATSAGATVGQYTMIWDVYYPESSDIKWRSLYQTSASNSDDGDLFVRNDPWGGIGINGIYHGAIRPGEWNRVAVTRDGAGTMTKYINGGYVGQQSVSSSRWNLSSTFHLLADENNDTQPGYLSSYRFTDHAMTPQEIFQLGGANAQGTAVPGPVFENAAGFTPGAFTVAVLGDTQSYAANSAYASNYIAMTQWLVDNKSNRNIQFVMHVGDVVDADDTTQWNRAMTAMNKLDGQIPYAVAPGNHDYGGSRSVSQFNQLNRFGPGSNYASQSTLQGYYPNEPNSRMNTYSTFQANGRNYLVMELEFGPRDAVVDWAAGVLDTHPDYHAILLTHAYMFDGGMWFDASVDPTDPQGRTHDQVRDGQVNHEESIYNPHSYSFVASDTNDGKELWDKLVKDHNNVSLVMTGHQYDDLDGFPYLMTENDSGNPVYQMLFDTQSRQAGGEGWIRLFEFDPDGVTIHVKSYSPYFNQWSYASDECFTIVVPEPSAWAILGMGVLSGMVFFGRRRKSKRFFLGHE